VTIQEGISNVPLPSINEDMEDVDVTVTHTVHRNAKTATTQSDAALKLAVTFAGPNTLDAFSKRNINMALAIAAAILHKSPVLKDIILVSDSVSVLLLPSKSFGLYASNAVPVNAVMADSIVLVLMDR
jgi:hypothetical protein